MRDIIGAALDISERAPVPVVDERIDVRDVITERRSAPDAEDLKVELRTTMTKRLHVAPRASLLTFRRSAPQVGRAVLQCHKTVAATASRAREPGYDRKAKPHCCSDENGPER